MISLAELQRQFQQHVLAGDLAVTRQINASANVPAPTRLAIYADAYRLRLIEALGGNFPRLQQWLGDEAFAAIARRYIDSHPSAARSIRWYGAALSACLELSHPLQPWLADLAQWEWLIAAAFDGRDAAALDSAVLAEVPPDQWPTLRFEFHPSMQRIVLQHERTGAVQGADGGDVGARAAGARATTALVDLAKGPADELSLAGGCRSDRT